MVEKKPIPAEIVEDPSIMSGAPVVRGTRIPADTIIAYLCEEYSDEEIFADYPSLPLDGIKAVIKWAEKTYGPDWKTAKKTVHVG